MSSADAARTLQNRARAYVLLVAVTLVWGTTFPLVKAALRDCSPLLFNLLRMTLASALLLAAGWRGIRGLRWRQWKLCAAAGLCLAAGYELQMVGLARTTPSKSAFLTGLIVVFVPLLSSLPGLRPPGAPRPHAAGYLGALIAFIGIALLTSEPGAGSSLFAGMHLGEWLTLGCAVVFALHLLAVSRAAGQLSAQTLGALQISFAAAAMLAMLPLQPHPIFHWRATVVAALLITSVLATAAAFTIQSWVQQHLPASHTALILTLEPIFAWLTSLLFLGERLGARPLLGALSILLGIVLAELGPTAMSGASILHTAP